MSKPTKVTPYLIGTQSTSEELLKSFTSIPLLEDLKKTAVEEVRVNLTWSERVLLSQRWAGGGHIGFVFRLHNKTGPQIFPWHGALTMDHKVDPLFGMGLDCWIMNQESQFGNWHILGPFNLNAKKIKEGATRSASNDSKSKAMKAVFEAWRDHQ